MMNGMEGLIKESGAKPPKRKIGKQGKIAIVMAIVMVGILIGAYLALTTPAPPPEKYWKPEKEFKMPTVDWSAMKSSYVVERKHYDDINGTNINQTIGSKKSDGNFEVEIVVPISHYTYVPTDFDSVVTSFYVSFTKLGGDYTVKELIFKYHMSDNYTRTPSFNYHSFAAKNLYFTADTGVYPTPYGAVGSRFDYEWWALHQVRGINKDVSNIDTGGFSSVFQIFCQASLYDQYPHWENHTVTFTAILEYGKYVHGWLGDHWEDVHTLDTSVKLYIVPEGGD